MRSDYGLYVVAVICFVIAVAFAGGAVPGYTLQEAQGLTVTVVFFALGIISAAVGYSARPKVMMPAPPMRAPIATPAPETRYGPQSQSQQEPEPVLETPPPAPMEEPQPEAAPPEPSAPLVTTPTASLEAEAPASTPAPAMPPTESMPEQKPEQLEADVEKPKTEEAPKEKPTRRRRRKTQ